MEQLSIFRKRRTVPVSPSQIRVEWVARRSWVGRIGLVIARLNGWLFRFLLLRLRLGFVQPPREGAIHLGSGLGQGHCDQPWLPLRKLIPGLKVEPQRELNLSGISGIGDSAKGRRHV